MKIDNMILRKTENLERQISSALSFLEKNYLANNNYEIVPIPQEIEDLDFNKSIRMLKLERFVYERDEKIIEKLSSVYSALHGDNSSVFLFLNSNGKVCDFYIGIRKTDNAIQSFNILKSSLEGNFPGTKFNDNYRTENIQNMMDNILSKENSVELTSVIGIPSIKKSNDNNFLQGIENLINGMQGKAFSALIIADPIANEKLEIAKDIYENIYTNLSLFKSKNFTLSKNETQTLTETVGESLGKTYTESDSTSESNSETRGESFSKGKTKSLGNIASSAGGALGATIGIIVPGLGTVAGGVIGAGLGNALAGIIGSTNDSTSISNSKTSSKSNSHSESYGETKSKQTSTSKGNSSGNSEGIQYSQENKKISNILKKLDKQFERLEVGESNGLWNVGAYFISGDVQNSSIAANIYSGVLKGNKSGIEKTALRTFYRGNEIEEIKNYLFNFHNPLISYQDGFSKTINTLTSLVSTDELTLQLNIPKKSVTGLKVMEMASFGRNIEQKSGMNIGKLYHLGKKELLNLNLDINSLSAHTFITGSTGSGKSNTVYKLIDKLVENEVKFLVIEPAKGEYKQVFGGREDVNVYGTNIEHTPLLKLNPFKFSDKIHILEHIDKFIEILNAVWPMYAAMPAVLKDALEEVYREKGWDLEYSINMHENPIYPDFRDLLSVLPHIIDRSGYSEEVKSNYNGALVTRVKSLTNGIIGRIFNSDEIDQGTLFDENTVIDLSRIGSVETKSLLMAIIFLKLQEYRLTTSTKTNANLKHVTVIEEAHNLLKKVSHEQSSEGSNMQGKSVEMISNSIAEMRTYGEGFVIIDQSPTLLDESVIKNTNTKLVLRLPSHQDREVVGKSMNLNEKQISELAKLETGVAAVFQNNWEEAVLSKIDYFDNYTEYNYSYNKKADYKKMIENKNLLIGFLLKDKLNKKIELTPEKQENFNNFINESCIFNSFEKEEINQLVKEGKDLEFGKKSHFISRLLNGSQIVKSVCNKIGYFDPNENTDYQIWHNEILNALENNNKTIDNTYKVYIVDSILRNEAEKSKAASNLYINWSKEIREGRIL